MRNGISAEAAESIFADMETFAQYAFNKSHAAAYAVVAYETGYLKRYYPVEFMAALMTSVMGDAKYISRVYPKLSGDGHRGAAAERSMRARRSFPLPTERSVSASWA